MPANTNTNKLKLLARNQRLSVSDKQVIQGAAQNIAELEAKVKELTLNLNSETKLKRQPKVVTLIEKEKLKERKANQTKIATLNRALAAKDQKLTELTNLLNVNKTKAVNKQDFNNFISSSIKELQTSFDQSTSDSEVDVLIRDVEIEAQVITEMHNNKPVFIIPSRVDMKELGSENFQKLKYFLSVVPKDM